MWWLSDERTGTVAALSVGRPRVGSVYRGGGVKGTHRKKQTPRLRKYPVRDQAMTAREITRILGFFFGFALCPRLATASPSRGKGGFADSHSERVRQGALEFGLLRIPWVLPFDRLRP